jgi:hypothetical protein
MKELLWHEVFGEYVKTKTLACVLPDGIINRAFVAYYDSEADFAGRDTKKVKIYEVSASEEDDESPSEYKNE